MRCVYCEIWISRSLFRHASTYHTSLFGIIPDRGRVLFIVNGISRSRCVICLVVFLCGTNMYDEDFMVIISNFFSIFEYILLYCALLNCLFSPCSPNSLLTHCWTLFSPCSLNWLLGCLYDCWSLYNCYRLFWLDKMATHVSPNVTVKVSQCEA